VEIDLLQISLTGGVLDGTGCDGNISPISRVGFPGLCLKDSGNGVRQTVHVNGYPAAIHAGAS
jgi:beta-glucosidase